MLTAAKQQRSLCCALVNGISSRVWRKPGRLELSSMLARVFHWLMSNYARGRQPLGGKTAMVIGVGAKSDGRCDQCWRPWNSIVEDNYNNFYFPE